MSFLQDRFQSGGHGQGVPGRGRSVIDPSDTSVADPTGELVVAPDAAERRHARGLSLAPGEAESAWHGSVFAAGLIILTIIFALAFVTGV